MSDIKLKLPIVLIGVLLLLSVVVVAETEYLNIGGTDFDFSQGNGGFNAGAVSSQKSRGLSDGEYAPLVGDIDVDGVNEIVILDGSTIKIYEGTTLELINSVTINQSGCKYAPLILFNIDDDAPIEIIAVPQSCTEQVWYAYEYFNDTFTLEYSQPFTATNSPTLGITEHVVGCGLNDGEEPQCVLVSMFNSGLTHVFRAQGFNATATGASVILLSDNNAGRQICFPRVRNVVFADYDGDDTSEFIFSSLQGISTGTNDDIFRITYLDVFPSLNITFEGEVVVDDSNPVQGWAGANACTSVSPITGATTGDLLTSPIVGDFIQGGDLETVFAYMVDENEFRMIIYDSGFGEIDGHPEGIFGIAAEADGRIVGTIMQLNVFGDTGVGKDYCVYAVDDFEQRLTLLCGNVGTGRTTLFTDDNTIEFVASKDGLFNISLTYGDFTNIAHASNMKDEKIEITEDVFFDIDEVVTPFGVYELTNEIENGTFLFWTKYEMNRIFPFDSEKACIPVDYEQIGASDLICRSDTILTYINDGLVNGNAFITRSDENPCINDVEQAGVVGVNTTFEVTLLIEDFNSFPLLPDLVNSRVTLYVGSPNEQVSQFLNQTSGVPVTHSFQFPPEGINATGTVNLRYEAWDNGNPSNIDLRNQVFTVANVGVVFGDCVSTTITGVDGEVLPQDVLAAAIPDDNVNNGITTALITLNALLGLGGVTIWFIVMIVMSLAVWMPVMEGAIGGSAALGIITILNVLMIFLGAQLGVLSTGLVVILVVVGVVIIGVFLGKFLTGTSTDA